jgi:phosphatidylglycerol:prolipoprotein diacylglycerol transferase
MLPYVGPVPAFAVGYLLAALMGGGAMIWRTRQSGYNWAQSWTIFVSLTVALIVGSKLLYLIESWPQWLASPGELSAAVLSPRMRIPGGLVLAIALGPWIADRIGVRFFAYADTVVPAAGLLLVGIRIGCFLEGCCYGIPSQVPWSVRFPASTEVYRWQVANGLIASTAARTCPVHPLQLYFALVGLWLFTLLSWRSRRKRYDGEVFLFFLVSYFWSTWLLESLRALPHELSRQLVLAGAVLSTAAALGLSVRAATEAGNRIIESASPAPGRRQ